MKKQKNIFLTTTIFIIIIVCSYSVYLILNLTTNNIPKNVMTKYEELAKEYKKSMGAYIEFCQKDNSIIYAVAGSGGYTGITFYYDNQGNEQGYHGWGDALTLGDIIRDENGDIINFFDDDKPPINIEGYSCKKIKCSSHFICKQ